MAAKKNGRNRGEQPAKPSRQVTEKVEHVVTADRGTTIREEFAIRCLAALLSNPRFADPDIVSAALVVVGMGGCAALAAFEQQP